GGKSQEGGGGGAATSASCGGGGGGSRPALVLRNERSECLEGRGRATNPRGCAARSRRRRRGGCCRTAFPPLRACRRPRAPGRTAACRGCAGSSSGDSDRARRGGRRSAWRASGSWKGRGRGGRPP